MADLSVSRPGPWDSPPRHAASEPPRHAAPDPGETGEKAGQSVEAAETAEIWPVLLPDKHRPADPDASRPPSTIGDPGRAHAEVRPRLRADPSQPPDTVSDHGTAGALDVRAASVRGLSHRESGAPRQDAYGLAVTADERFLIVAVADGVSAGPLSHVAASFVARRGPRDVARRLDSGVAPGSLPWPEIFTALAGTIIAEGARSLCRAEPARYAATAPSEEEVAAAMATTATFLVCPVGPALGAVREVQVAWLGDSPVWALDPAGGWHNLSAIKGFGEEVGSSGVVALPQVPRDPADLPHACCPVPDDWTLLVMTDGTGDPLGPGQGEVAARLAGWWRRPPPPLLFTEQVGFGRRSYDDDRTVVAVWPSGARDPG
ncbi:protein phosphatase 2C domain-containing protein [Actinoplanes rectilineatus]|uniref:protein phosphatase 2C domain-containing protein n=1 Tax=Actinoplanes rectilineatus TaxID=113571 RepID=UPI0005F2C728|nr:protein phosphatase 2C domain-containing protein [Actinoplanes rectilineatus]